MKSLLIFSLFLAFANAADLVTQGDAHDRKFQPDRALQFYLTAEKETPNDATLLVKIARQYVYRMDDLKSTSDRLDSGKTALTYAERAVKAAPGASDSHLAVAIVWGKLTPLMGNREKIEASRKIKDAAQKAVRLNPRDDYAWHMLGRWHQALAGMGAMTRGIAQVVYGSLPAASNEEAVKCFQKASALNPNRLIHHIELGRTFAQMGKIAEAKAAISKGLAMPNQEKDDPESKIRGKSTLAKLN